MRIGGRGRDADTQKTAAQASAEESLSVQQWRDRERAQSPRDYRGEGYTHHINYSIAAQLFSCGIYTIKGWQHHRSVPTSPFYVLPLLCCVCRVSE